MVMDYGTFAAVWLLCGFTFGVWFTYHRFHGGHDSQYCRDLRKRFPGADAINPWVLYGGAAIGLVAYVIVWPYPVVTNLVAARRARVNSHPLYMHPKLARLRSKMNGHEEDYEGILSAFGLGAVVTALHAIDLPAAVDFAFEVVAKEKAERDGGDGTPEKPSVQDYEDASYVNVMKFALGYTEMQAWDASRNRVQLGRAMDKAAELIKRYVHIRNPGMSIGHLIVFHVHGWAPEAKLTLLKEMYAQHLKPGFNSADHMYAVFSGIQVAAERDVKRVVLTKSELTDEEYTRLMDERYSSPTSEPPKTSGDQETDTHKPLP
jgi:hypothetical protein